MDFDRRTLISGAGVAGVGLGLAGGSFAAADAMVDLRLPGGPSERPLMPRFPQKGDMIVQRVRPPLLETPFEVFDPNNSWGVITPNDRFFVRWSGGVMPTSIDAAAFRLAVRGAVRAPQSLSLAEVARVGERVEVTAVNQCAGNSRGFSEPRVSGAQWGNGAMGNAVWRGVRLRDLLDKAGVGADAKRVRFAGLDTPMVDGAPQKIKSIPIDIARRDDVIVAWGMNGEMLPLLNGYPLRLIVPGWFATYWIKMLSDIEVLATDQDDSYFMAKTYRMPSVPVKPGDKDFPTVPITTMGPRSWVTSHVDGETVAPGSRVEIRGIAFGGDCGVGGVSLNVIQGGPSPITVPPPFSAVADLEPEQGKFGFREWRYVIGVENFDVAIQVKCANTNGVSQPEVQAWNPSGYARNVIERIRLRVA